MPFNSVISLSLMERLVDCQHAFAQNEEKAPVIIL